MEKKDIKKEIVQCSLAYILLSGSGGLVDKVNLEAVESSVLRSTIAKVQFYFSAEGEYKPTITTYNDSHDASVHDKSGYDKCFGCQHERTGHERFVCVYERSP